MRSHDYIFKSLAWAILVLPLAQVSAVSRRESWPSTSETAIDVVPTQALRELARDSDSVFTATGSVAQQTSSEHRSHTVEVAPSSIEKLATASERVFIGKVIAIAPLAEDRPEFSGIPKKDLRKVTLKVITVLKGNGKITRDSTLVVKQYVPRAPEVEQDQTVLWFLPSDSAIGFATPIGITSGSFDVLPNPRFKGHSLAVNGHQNRGLWDENHSLWDLYSADDARDLLISFGFGDAFIQEVLAAGEQKGSYGPLPVELLRVVLFLRPISNN